MNLNNLITGRFFLLLVLIFAFVSFAAGQEVVKYQITPVPMKDRTELDLTVNFKAETRDAVKVILPTDCFGTPDIDRFVTSFEGTNQTVVEKGEKANERFVKASANGEVSIKYKLSYDPEIFDQYSYGPNVGADYFHLAGCQFLLHLGDDRKQRRFEFEIRNVPAKWQVYSSYSPTPAKFALDSSYENLAAGVIGGGENFSRFTVKGKPVSVFVHGNYDIPNKEIYRSAERLVRLQRDWFKDYDQPFYQIVIAPRSGNIAGYAPDNSFICFIKSDITKLELNWLLSHELFHNWLGNKIRIALPKDASFVRYEWFTEGVNDYFARKILREAGLIDHAQFAAYVNKDIMNIADNPNRSKTLDEIAAAAKNNRYNAAYKKLSYYRGALMALKWETELRNKNAKKDLSDFIRELYKIAQNHEGGIPEQTLFDLAAGYGFDLKKDLTSYIERGEPIEILPGSLGKDYELREKLIPSFDPGFDLPQSFQNGKISGVAESGAAGKAGLREGAELVSIENSNRFGNAWYADKPLVVTVKENELQRRIEYFPHGAPITVKLFERR